MRKGILVLLIAALGAMSSAGAQTKKPTPRKPAATAKAPAKAPATKSGPIEVKCPATLGVGTTTKRVFCDVLTGVNPAEGIVMPMPARTGAATLTFDLHSRHTYSETEVKTGKAYARYTATVVLANLKGEVLGRATVQSEFRSAADLLDRVSGGAAPGGIKAVAPVGTETVVFDVPDDVTEVVVLGERLTVQRLDGREVFASAGRPVAVLSNATLEYRPKPAKAPAKPARKTTRKR